MIITLLFATSTAFTLISAISPVATDVYADLPSIEDPTPILDTSTTRISTTPVDQFTLKSHANEGADRTNNIPTKGIVTMNVTPTPPPPFASTGTHLKIGIDSAAHYGDYNISYGFQYPHGFEHLAVGWWGEGFTLGYTVASSVFLATSYEDYPGVTNLNLLSATVIADTSEYAIYETVSRTADGRVELVHNFRFYKDTKFVILNATIKNVGNDTLSGLRYRRIWDMDVDSEFYNEFNVDLSRYMLYASNKHYVGLAAYSGTPPTEWDVNAWDDVEVYMPGKDVYTGPFPVYGDYNVRLEWVYTSMAPEEAVEVVMYHIGGDSKADLDSSYMLAETEVGKREHELAVALEAPAFLKLGDSVSLNATVYNLGLSNETDVELYLVINDSVAHYEIIPTLPSGSSYTFSYLWTPLAEGSFNVTAYVPPVPGEAFTANNRYAMLITVLRPLIQPVEGQWANYTIRLTERATDMSMSMRLNVTYSRYVSSYQMNATVWMTDPYGRTITGWLILNVLTRQVEAGMWSGLWYPLWIETNVTINSTVRIFDTTGIVIGSRLVEVGELLIDSWELRTYFYGAEYLVLFDKVTGVVTGIEGENPYFIEQWKLIATNILKLLPMEADPETGAVGTQVTITGAEATPNGTVEIYWDDNFMGTTTSNSFGNFSYTFPVPPSTRGPHHIVAIDVTTRISGVATFVVVPSVSVTPTAGAIGTMVEVTGFGFGANEYVVLSFDDMRMTEVPADEHGSFSAVFSIPLSEAGLHSIKAWYDLSFVEEAFRVIDVTQLEIQMDVGAIFFKGETAEFYVQTSLRGAPVDVTSMKVTLYKPDETNETLEAQRIAKGLYKIAYSIKGKGSMEGTYTLTVEASYNSDTVDAVGTSLETFVVKSPWREWEREGPKALLSAVTIATVFALIVVWRKEVKKLNL